MEYDVPSSLIGYALGAIDEIASYILTKNQLTTTESDIIVGSWLLSQARNRGVNTVSVDQIKEALEVLEGMQRGTSVTAREFGETLIELAQERKSDEPNNS